MLSRVVCTAVTALLLVAPFNAHAAPAPATPLPAAHPSITLVQGWWEHEHREEEARERYWKLPPEALERYNHLQAEINELQEQRHEIDEHIAHEIAEQRRILGVSGY
jgi:hypothetical protein